METSSSLCFFVFSPPVRIEMNCFSRNILDAPDGGARPEVLAKLWAIRVQFSRSLFRYLSFSRQMGSPIMSNFARESEQWERTREISSQCKYNDAGEYPAGTAATIVDPEEGGAAAGVASVWFLRPLRERFSDEDGLYSLQRTIACVSICIRGRQGARAKRLANNGELIADARPVMSNAVHELVSGNGSAAEGGEQRDRGSSFQLEQLLSAEGSGKVEAK